MSQHAYQSIVIGAGQSGLAASYELKRRGIDHIVLDANSTPGGAWQHRWDSLTMNDVHRVADLPGASAPGASSTQSNKAIPDYFARYEKEFELPVVRPVKVTSVRNAQENPQLLEVQSENESWLAETVVSASGTWMHPFLPYYPGAEKFKGLQIHAAGYTFADVFKDKKVLVVGGGASAVQLIGEVAHTAREVLWATRSEPSWRKGPVDGLASVTWVESRTTQGLPPSSVVTSTGLTLRPQEEFAKNLGIYERRVSMFEELTEHGAKWADGTVREFDAIIWATGFRYAFDYLAPLKLRSEHGGIALESVKNNVQGATTAVKDARVKFVGYGPSASTVGASKAGRQAAIAVRKFLIENK